MGAAVMQVVDKTKSQVSKNFDEISKAATSSKNMTINSKTIKGRPSVIKEESKLDIVKKYSVEYRSIALWNDKLENMLVILQADDMSSK